MNLKWLFFTGLLGTIVFFGAIFFGMKYNWVSGTQSGSASSKSNVKSSIGKPEIKASSNTAKLKVKSDSSGNGVNPELIDEVDTNEEQRDLGASDLTIEQVVSQCQSLSESIGVPAQRMEQAVGECVDRNSTHLTAENKSTNERAILIREQCNVAITQKELLSDAEVKMLVDECVAAMSPN